MEPKVKVKMKTEKVKKVEGWYREEGFKRVMGITIAKDAWWAHEWG